MLKRSKVIITVVLIVVANLALSKSKMFHRFVDKSIMGFVVGEDHEEKVASYLGKGTLVEKGYAWCYFSDDENQFIIFELGPDKIIEGIILSREGTPECQKTIIKNKKSLVTGKGIRLDDSIDKLIKIYGEPEKKEIKDGVHIFEYHTDYEKDPQVRLAYDAYLYLRDDKLIKLVIHDGE